MTKLLNNASCLIKTREYNIGFPFRFSHHPENMGPKELEFFHNVALEAMESPDKITADNRHVRKIVVSDGRFFVMAISGYLFSIVRDTENRYNSFCDLSNVRRCYGFAGFVWDLSACPIDEVPFSFPLPESFEELMRGQIITHWFDSDNSDWAANVRKGIRVPYNCEAYFENIPKKEESYIGELNLANKRTISVFPNKGSIVFIAKAIQAARERKVVSLCTDLHFYEEDGSWFMNITSSDCELGKVEYRNPRYVPQEQKVAQRSKENFFHERETEKEIGNGRKQRGDSPNTIKGGEADNLAYIWLIYEDREELRNERAQESNIFWNCMRNELWNKYKIATAVSFRKDLSSRGIDVKKDSSLIKTFNRYAIRLLSGDGFVIKCAYEVRYPDEIPYERLEECIWESVRRMQEDILQWLVGFEVQPPRKNKKKERVQRKKKPELDKGQEARRLIEKLESQYGSAENMAKKPAEDVSDLFDL